MSKEEKEEQKTYFWWVIALGSGLTVIYFAFLVWLEFGGLLPFAETVDKFRAMGATEAGDFLAGLFAPLAFMWFALSMLQTSYALQMQQKELRASIDEMRKGNETQELTSQHIRKDVFLTEYPMIMSMIEASLLRICDLHGLQEKRGYLKGDGGHRNIYIFALEISNANNKKDGLISALESEKYNGKTPYTRYMNNFRMLVKKASDIDVNLAKTYMESELGILYRTIHSRLDDNTLAEEKRKYADIFIYSSATSTE